MERQAYRRRVASVTPHSPRQWGTMEVDQMLHHLHGRYSGHGLPLNWIVADIVRMKDGILVEHWDVIQDEATRESSKSGLPMFGEKFGG